MTNVEKKSQSKIKAFFTNNEKVISGFASIAGVIALVATVITLGITVYQIIQTKNQVRANLSYQIHKDGREIYKSIQSDVENYIKAEDSSVQYPEDIKKNAERQMGEILMYYVSVYHQWKYKNIDEKDWSVISKGFCHFINYSNVKAFWDKYISNNPSWDKSFRENGQKCFEKKEEKK